MYNVSACNEQSHDASHCASTSDTATTVLKTENASGIISSVLSIRLGSYMQTLNPECARGYTQARASSGIPEESSAASDQNRSPVRHFAFGPRADPLLLSENPRLPEGCRSKMQLLHPPSERGWGGGGKEAGDNRCATRKIAIAISPCPHPRKRKLQIKTANRPRATAKPRKSISCVPRHAPDINIRRRRRLAYVAERWPEGRGNRGASRAFFTRRLERSERGSRNARTALIDGNNDDDNGEPAVGNDGCVMLAFVTIIAAK